MLQFDEKFQPRPYLATKWDVSPDGRTYTFHLQKGTTFHDGKPITSADAAFSLETVEILKAVRKDFGLDKTLAEQLFIYGKKVLSSDLGFSYFQGKPVLELILEKIPPTALLILTAMFLAVIVGVLTGVIVAQRPASIGSAVVTFLPCRSFGWGSCSSWPSLSTSPSSPAMEC